MRSDIKHADGVEGYLFCDFEGKTFFRVYENGEYTDYYLRHTDLGIMIRDWDAFFYTLDNGDKILDHSPETLGIKTK